MSQHINPTPKQTDITSLSDQISKEISDLNAQINTNVTGNQFAYYQATALNKPGTNSGYSQVAKIGSWTLQFAVDLAGIPYTRYRSSSGVISEWQQIATADQMETSLAELVQGSVHISRCGKLRTLYFNNAVFTAGALYTLQTSDRPIRNIQQGLPGSSSNYLFISNSGGAIGVLGSGGTYQAASGVNICVSYMTA